MGSTERSFYVTVAVSEHLTSVSGRLLPEKQASLGPSFFSFRHIRYTEVQGAVDIALFFFSQYLSK